MLFLPQFIEHERLGRLSLSEDNQHYTCDSLFGDLGIGISIELVQPFDEGYLDTLENAAKVLTELLETKGLYEQIKTYADACAMDIHEGDPSTDPWAMEQPSCQEEGIETTVCLEHVRILGDLTTVMDWHDVIVMTDRELRVTSMLMKPWFYL